MEVEKMPLVRRVTPTVFAKNSKNRQGLTHQSERIEHIGSKSAISHMKSLGTRANVIVESAILDI